MLRRLLKTIPSLGRGFLDRNFSYARRLAAELVNYSNNTQVHDLPPIFHYWSGKYLAPKIRALGFDDLNRFWLDNIVCLLDQREHDLRMTSLGSGNCDFEIGLVQALRAERPHAKFLMRCVDINPQMLSRGRKHANATGVEDFVAFERADVNSWVPADRLDIVLANHSLHHFVELEHIFATVHDVLPDDGLFLINDMIGRNGHMRWPEAIEQIDSIWRDMPRRYRYNHYRNRYDESFVNWDCSQMSFEGIRAQDILTLLIRQGFHFRVFLAFANIISPFIDRAFGRNFDPNSPEDCAFIDQIHEQDEAGMASGRHKPTQMITCLTKTPSPNGCKYIGNLSPTAAVREV